MKKQSKTKTKKLTPKNLQKKTENNKINTTVRNKKQKTNKQTNKQKEKNAFFTNSSWDDKTITRALKKYVRFDESTLGQRNQQPF